MLYAWRRRILFPDLPCCKVKMSYYQRCGKKMKRKGDAWFTHSRLTDVPKEAQMHLRGNDFKSIILNIVKRGWRNGSMVRSSFSFQVLISLGTSLDWDVEEIKKWWHIHKQKYKFWIMRTGLCDGKTTAHQKLSVFIVYSWTER